MDDVRDMKIAAMLAYAIADVLGARISGKLSEPFEVANRAAEFAQFLTVKAASTCGVVYNSEQHRQPAICPTCSGNGSYPCRGHDGNPIQVQCAPCDGTGKLQAGA